MLFVSYMLHHYISSCVDDRFDDIKEYRGEEFLNCGSCPSAIPPPSIGCAACPTNQAKFVVNPNFMSWEAHNTFANEIGCVMASITNADEQAAALKVIDTSIPAPQAGEISFFWFGASTIGDGQSSSWTWTDGSDDFPGDGLKSNDPAYRNWKSGQPDGNGKHAGLHFVENSFGFAAGEWDDAPGIWGALYKCCFVQPVATNFQACPVLS